MMEKFVNTKLHPCSMQMVVISGKCVMISGSSSLFTYKEKVGQDDSITAIRCLRCLAGYKKSMLPTRNPTKVCNFDTTTRSLYALYFFNQFIAHLYYYFQKKQAPLMGILQPAVEYFRQEHHPGLSIFLSKV